MTVRTRNYLLLLSSTGELKYAQRLPNKSTLVQLFVSAPITPRNWQEECWPLIQPYVLERDIVHPVQGVETTTPSSPDSNWWVAYVRFRQAVPKTSLGILNRLNDRIYPLICLNNRDTSDQKQRVLSQLGRYGRPVLVYKIPASFYLSIEQYEEIEETILSKWQEGHTLNTLFRQFPEQKHLSWLHINQRKPLWMTPEGPRLHVISLRGKEDRQLAFQCLNMVLTYFQSDQFPTHLPFYLWRPNQAFSQYDFEPVVLGHSFQTNLAQWLIPFLTQPTPLQVNITRRLTCRPSTKKVLLDAPLMLFVTDQNSCEALFEKEAPEKQNLLVDTQALCGHIDSLKQWLMQFLDLWLVSLRTVFLLKTETTDPEDNELKKTIWIHVKSLLTEQEEEEETI